MSWILSALRPADPPLSFAVPARTVIEGVGYTVTCNRHVALLAVGADDSLPVLASAATAYAKRIATAAPETATRLSHLTGWLAAHAALPDCAVCKNTRRTMVAQEEDCPDCDGSGEIVCSECGHDRDCDTCNGDGYKRTGKLVEEDCDCTAKPTPVQIGNHFVNARLLHEALRNAPDGEVRSGWNGGDRDWMLVLHGDGWMCGLMMLWWTEAAPIYEAAP